MTTDDDLFGGSDSDPANSDDDGPSIEEKARAFGIPWPVAKASVDPYTYAVGLRDGSVLVFESCEIDAEYKFVTLLGVSLHSFPPLQHGPEAPRNTSFVTDLPRPFNFKRGLVVRVEDILWAADAPYG